MLQGVKEVKEGIKTFVLSLPLDYPGGNGLNPRRHPPRIAATQRNGRQNFAYEVRQDNPMQTDVICDDLVCSRCSIRRSGTRSSAHIGSMFDADGDGKPEPVFYNGFRAGEHIKPAKEDSGVAPAGRGSSLFSRSKAAAPRRSASRISPSMARRAGA